MNKFVIYARKSTESEDRQVLSIDSQINELKQCALRCGVEIVTVFEESMSAKAPGRPIFNKLMEDVEAGKIAGIFCWKLDRLARNPVDGGRVIWTLKNKDFKIVTPAQTFDTASDNTFLMYVEFGMAQKYIDDLGRNVRRGNRAKLELGWLPGSAPMGYVNKLDDHTIIPDPERFELVQRMWRLLLTGAYSPEQVRKIANDDWGFRTRKTKRSGGTPLSKSGIYKLIRSPFYYGLIERTVEGVPSRYRGAHQPMITEDEYWDVQRILGLPSARPRNQRFAFTAMMRCGECGSGITAEQKKKPSGKLYAYYRCTKKNEAVTCSQSCMREEEAERQIRALLDRITLPAAFTDWSLRWLRKLNSSELQSRINVRSSLQKAYTDNETKLSRLTDMRLSDLLTDEEYVNQKTRLSQERARFKEKIDDLEHRADSWLDSLEQAFDFSKHAKERFDKGDRETRRKILLSLGSNFIVKDGILSLELEKVWEKFSSFAPKVWHDMEMLELDEFGQVNEKTTEFSSVILSWQGQGESNPR